MNEREQKSIPMTSSYMGTPFAARDPMSVSSNKSTPLQHFGTYQSKYSAKPYIPYNYMASANVPKFTPTNIGKSPIRSIPESGSQMLQSNLAKTSIEPNAYLSTRLAGLKTFSNPEPNIGSAEPGNFQQIKPDEIEVNDKIDENGADATGEFTSEVTFEPRDAHNIFPIKYTQPQ